MNARSLYQQFNERTVRDYPEKPLPELIDEVCDCNPNAIAVLSGGETQTYAELQRHSNQLANHLKAQGVQSGDLVGLCCNRDVDMPALMIGIMKSGAGYVPLDPGYPLERLHHMIQDSDVKHIVAHCTQLPLIE